MDTIAPRLAFVVALVASASWVYVIGAFTYCAYWPPQSDLSLQKLTPEFKCQIPHLWRFFIALTPAALVSLIVFPWLNMWRRAAMAVAVIVPWVALAYFAWRALYP
jgi:hypothetical protein